MKGGKGGQKGGKGSKGGGNGGGRPGKTREDRQTEICKIRLENSLCVYYVNFVNFGPFWISTGGPPMGAPNRIIKTPNY